MRKTIYIKDEDEAIFEEAMTFGEDPDVKGTETLLGRT